MSEMQQETATALANLATATTSDPTAFITLTNTNADLAKQITTLNAHLVTTQAKIATLTAQLAPKTGGSGNCSNNSTPSNGNFHDLDPKRYCWMYGWRVRKGHSSSTCSKWKTGHDATAIQEGLRAVVTTIGAGRVNNRGKGVF